MLVQKRMKSKQTRSHKGYHNISIYTAPTPKRRNNNNGLQSLSESSSYSSKSDDNKYGKKWWAEKLQSGIGIVLVLVIFLIVTIVIYMHMPDAGSSLPPENTTKHEELHSTVNDIISPRFNVDTLLTNSIAKINPTQSLGDNYNINGKLGIVFFLSELKSNNDNFCSLLLSISSAISAITTSSSNIDIVLFMHYKFEINKLALDKLSNAMKFKIFKYQLNGAPMITHIIKILSKMTYDTIIYLDHYSFVLRDPSNLFNAISIEKYHFGGIWSFHQIGNNEYQQCLLPSIFMINLNHIKKYNKSNHFVIIRS